MRHRRARLRYRPLTVVLLALVALSALSACSGGSRAGETKKPTLTVYSGRREELVGQTFKDFEKATGIKAKVKYGDTAELASQILEEGKNSPADVFFAQDAGSLGAIQQEGAFVKLPEAILSRVSPGFRSRQGDWVGVTGRSRTVVYNPDKLKPSDFPKSILAFNDPKWNNRLGWAPSNASFQAFITALRKVEGEAGARKWLEDMKKLGIKTYPNNITIVQAVSAGEIDAGFVNHYYALELKAQNPALKAENYFIGNGDVGALVNAAGVGILKTSDNQDLARKFIEFLLSPPAQKSFTERTFEYPLTIGVAANPTLTPIDQLQSPKIDLADLKDLAGTLKLLKDVGLL